MIPANETERRKKEAQKYMDRVISLMALSDTGTRKIICANTKRLIEESFSYKNLGTSFHFAANDRLDQITSDILKETEKQIFNAIYMDCYNVDAIAHEKED